MQAKVVAGKVFGVEGPIQCRTPAYFIDFIMTQADKTYRHSIPAGWNSMLVLYEGSVEVQGVTVKSAPHAMNFAASADGEEDIEIRTTSERARFLILAGRPLNEPIANYGPFVLTTQDQLRQAFDDFQNGMNGFENARNWRSEIRNMKHRNRSV